MDLLQLTQSETADCVITDPHSGEATDFVVTLYGPGTKQYKEALKIFTAHKDGEKDAEALAMVTAGWKGFENDGKPFPFNQKNAELAYSQSIPLKAQVSTFLFGIKNFLPKR